MLTHSEPTVIKLHFSVNIYTFHKQELSNFTFQKAVSVGPELACWLRNREAASLLFCLTSVTELHHIQHDWGFVALKANNEIQTSSPRHNHKYPRFLTHALITISLRLHSVRTTCCHFDSFIKTFIHSFIWKLQKLYNYSTKTFDFCIKEEALFTKIAPGFLYFIYISLYFYQICLDGAVAEEARRPSVVLKLCSDWKEIPDSTWRHSVFRLSGDVVKVQTFTSELLMLILRGQRSRSLCSRSQIVISAKSCLWNPFCNMETKNTSDCVLLEQSMQ